VKAVAPDATPAKEPSAKGDFAEVVQAQVTRSDLGYCLRADAKKTGLALKKLPTPLKGKVSLKVRMKAREEGELKNGFLAFGDGPEEARLVKCGLRLLQGNAVIVDGPLNGGKTVAEKIEVDEAAAHEIAVTLDLGSGQVTMTTGAHKVSATLARRPESISHIGYCVINAVTDFSPVETGGN